MMNETSHGVFNFMSIYSKEFMDGTIKVSQPFSSSVLLDEEAREITDNIIGLSSLLSAWQNKDGEKNENNKEEE